MVAENKKTDNALVLRGRSCEHYATMYFDISVVYNDSKCQNLRNFQLANVQLPCTGPEVKISCIMSVSLPRR